MHAFLTVFPSSIEFRLSDGKGGSEPLQTILTNNEGPDDAALARLAKVLLTNRVETVEIRYENVDD